MEINSQFQRMIQGLGPPLDPEAFMNFKVHCSKVFTSLKQWTDLAMNIYRVSVAQCLDLLLYAQKHEISRQAYRQHTNNVSKIQIYNSLAALYLCRDNKVSSGNEKEKMFEMAKRYINLAEKVEVRSGKTILTLKGSTIFYEDSVLRSMAYFSKAAEISPGNQQPQSVIGMLGLAQVYFAKQNYEGALQQYKKALRTNKALPARARLGMAYCFYQLEKYEMAQLCFKRLLDMEPNCIEAILGHAILNYHEGYKEDYFRAIQRCYQLDPANPLVLLHLAQHLLLSNSTTNLPSVIQKALQESKKWPTFANKNDQFRDDRVVLRCRLNHLLGQMHHQQGEYEYCLKHYDLALNKSLPYVRVNLAQAYINPSNFVDAAKLLEGAFATIPSKYRKLMNETYKTLAYIKSKVTIKKDRSQLNEAIHLYSEALKYNKEDFQSFIECANILFQSDPKRSQSFYHHAYDILQRQNKFVSPELLNNIGVLKCQLKQEEDAQYFLKLALKQIKEWSHLSVQDEQLKQIKQKAFLVTFYLNLGILYEDSFRFRECMEFYNLAKETNPLYMDVYVRQAFLAARRGEYQVAFQRCSEAEEICQANKNRHVNRDKIILTKSYLYKMIGDQRRAKEILKDAPNEPYKKILDQSLEYDLKIYRGDSNARNLKEMLKQKVKPALKILEDDPYNLYGVLYFGVLAATLQKPREAILCLNALKEMDNQHPKVLLNLGVYYFKNQQYDTSLMLLKKYVDKSVEGGDFTAELTICFILLIKHRYEEAIKNVKKLIMVRPQNLMLRYHLAFFTQRASQRNLDSEKRQPKKISQAILYIRRIKNAYAFFSKIKPDQYTSHITNNEVKEKLREELTKTREKSDDQKMYIKSRQDRFSFYEKDAENKERMATEEKTRLVNKAKEVRERQKRAQEQEQRQRDLAAERRREIDRRNKQLEERLNREYREDQEVKSKGKQRKTRQTKSQKRGKRRRNEEPESEAEFIEPAEGKQGEQDNDAVQNKSDEEQAPKKHRRLMKRKAGSQEEKESSDDRMEEKDPSVRSQGNQDLHQQPKMEIEGQGLEPLGQGIKSESPRNSGSAKKLDMDDEFLNQLQGDE